jgi:hypothetical protein
MADRSEEARLRAEANFKKKQQRAEEGEKVWAAHLAAGKAADANRAKLKALRLAQEAQDAGAEPSNLSRKGPTRDKRRKDAIGNAMKAGKIAPRQGSEDYEGPPEKSPAAIELGRRGGRKRAEMMAAETRADMATKASESPRFKK